MKFQAYLVEALKGKRLEHDEFMDLLKSSKFNPIWKEMVKNEETRIFRGQSDTGLYGYRNTTPEKPRESKDNQNYYNYVINEFPAWKHYPRRQVICITSYGGAGGWSLSGKRYHIIPAVGTDIGVCPSDDIWGVWKKISQYTNKGILDWEKEMKIILGLFDEFSLVDSINYNIDNFIKALKKIKPNKNLQEQGKWLSLKDFFNSDKFKNLYDYTNWLLDPIENGFWLQEAGDKINSKTGSKEVWFDGECLLLECVNYSLESAIQKYNIEV